MYLRYLFDRYLPLILLAALLLAGAVGLAG